MNTTSTYNTGFISVGIMIFIFVIIPSYLIIKNKSYKTLKITSFILFVTMTILSIGAYITGGLLNSFIALFSGPALIIGIYYLLIYLFTQLQYTRKTISVFPLYVLLFLLFSPIVYIVIDFEGFINLSIFDLVTPEIDMK